MCHMGTDQLNTLLHRLPSDQRESAGERIADAERYGWRDIHLPDVDLPGTTAHEDCLTGRRPSDGHVTFIP